VTSDGRGGTRLWTPPQGGLSRREFLKRSSHVALGGLLASSAGTILSACGPSGPGSGGGDPAALQFWQWYAPQEGGGSQSVAVQSDWFTNVVDDWNAQNETQIELVFIPIAQYIEGTQVQSAFAAGSGPDLFVISPGDFLRYYNGDVLLDLTDFLSDEARGDFYQSVISSRVIDDRIYGLPMESEPVTMFYSVDAFEEAGLSEADIPTTWDQLLDVAERLTTPERFGVLFETTPNVYQNFIWYPFLWQAGGDVVDESGLEAAFDSPAAVAALELWQQAIAIGVAPRTMQGGGGGDLVANLAGGYAAMAPMVTAGGSFLEAGAPDFRYGMFPLPTPEEGDDPITDMGGWAFVVNKNGRNPEAAAQFAAMAVAGTDDAAIDRMIDWAFDAKQSLPVRKSVMQRALDNGRFDEDELMAYALEVVGLDRQDATADTFPYGRGEPRFTPEVVKAVSDAIQGAQLGGQDPATAALGAHDLIDNFLSAYSGAPLGS
jgi:multiple sugar transport system substrate-binding protein